jgi:hypothetical protein
MRNGRRLRRSEGMASVVKDPGQSRPALEDKVKSCFLFSLPCESAGETTFKIFRDHVGPVILDKVADSLGRLSCNSPATR